MIKVAFICVHNSCRSQIAEALGKHFAADAFESYSAGIKIRPLVRVINWWRQSAGSVIYYMTLFYVKSHSLFIFSMLISSLYETRLFLRQTDNTSPTRNILRT